MDYYIRCPHCAIRLEVGAQEVARDMVCPECAHRFVVPVTGIVAGVTNEGFWIKRRISGGSVSEIFEAQKMESNQKMLLKVLGPLVTERQEALGPYMDGLQRVLAVDHPNVVRLLETGTFMGHVYLAYPLVGGLCLDAYLTMHGAMPEAEALKTGVKVARIMEDVWQAHGIVHGNLKPANLLLDSNAEIFLFDMGHRRLRLAPEADLQWLTANPPYYFSPEQILGQEDTDYRSDMYALGATLYHLATGQPPFFGGDVAEVMGQHLEEMPQRPSKLGDNVSSEFDKVVMRLMAKDRDDRFPTWAEAIKAMKIALKGNKRHTTKTKLNLAPTEKDSMLASGGANLAHFNQPRKGPSGIAIAIGLVVALLLMIVVVVVATQSSGAPPTDPVPVQRDDAKLARLEAMFKDAKAYTVAHPEDYDGAIELFSKVRNEGLNTEYQQRAQQEVSNLRKAKKAASGL